MTEQYTALAHLGSVSGGICYNKKVWADAGITEMPKTADEFIADLKKIKEKFPDVIPYYTNFKEASWTASQWSSLVVPSSGNPNFETDLIVNKEDFFTEGKPYYNVFKLMYDIYSDSTLIEGDRELRLGRLKADDCKGRSCYNDNGFMGSFTVPADR